MSCKRTQTCHKALFTHPCKRSEGVGAAGRTHIASQAEGVAAAHGQVQAAPVFVQPTNTEMLLHL